MATKIAKRRDIHGSGPVRYHIEGPAENPTRASIAIDYTDAPVPQHYYVADYFYLENLDPQILLVFGKHNVPKRDELRNKLEIYFPAMFFVKQLWKSSREFHRTLRDFVEKYKYTVIGPGSQTASTEKIQTIHSNNAIMVLSGGECMMDFFYLSPRDLYFRIRKQRDLVLEALVRVIIPPTLLLGFLDECEPIAQLLAPKFAKEEESDEEDLES